MTASNAALDDLYRRFAPVVFRRARQILADEQDALDAVQEVFVILQQKLDSFRGEAAIMTWIYRITTNHCLNLLRSRRARERATEAWRQVPRPAAIEDGGTALEQRQIVTRLLSEFSPRQVQAVVHTYLDEMSQAEVAETLGVSERAVRKALKKVRDEAGAALSQLERQEQPHG